MAFSCDDSIHIWFADSKSPEDFAWLLQLLLLLLLLLSVQFHYKSHLVCLLSILSNEWMKIFSAHFAQNLNTWTEYGSASLFHSTCFLSFYRWQQSLCTSGFQGVIRNITYFECYNVFYEFHRAFHSTGHFCLWTGWVVDTNGNEIFVLDLFAMHQTTNYFPSNIH